MGKWQTYNIKSIHAQQTYKWSLFKKITRLKIKITMQCYNFVNQVGKTGKYGASQF